MPKTRWNMSSYPRGWFVIAYGTELENQGVRPLRYFGQDLVLFRDQAGQPALLDAYCTHLGTHLGVGGVVEDGCIRCPMHGWRFDASGGVVSASLRPTPHRTEQRSTPGMCGKGQVSSGPGTTPTVYHPRGNRPRFQNTLTTRGSGRTAVGHRRRRL